MSFKELLERNGVDTTGYDAAFITTPLSPFFLEEKYVRDTCKIAEIPADLTDEAVQFAAKIMQTPELKTLAWHLYRVFCFQPNFKAFPDHIDVTGKDTGILYLLVMLSLYPHLQQRMTLEGLPLYLADHAMTRCTSLLPNRGIIYPGERGLQGRALPFMLNYKNSSCFRIGRFDYVLTRALHSYPELFRERATGKYVGLCRSGWKVDETGFLQSADNETLPAVELTENNGVFTGRKVDLVTGRVTRETISIDTKEYDRLLPPDACVLLIHIPGGGGMTLEKCKESFKEARDFCKRYFPERSFSCFGCISWIFNPVWRESLPEANITKLQKATLAFPFTPVPKSGLYFVFAKDDGTPADYPADNSMRRAMLKAWEGAELRSAGMLLPLDEIDNFPLNVEDMTI